MRALLLARARYPAVMKRAISLLAVLLLLSRSHAGECAIEVEAGVWNGASVPDVHAVLASAQDELWKHCDGLDAPGVKVVFNKEHPAAWKTLAWFRHSKAGPDAPLDAHLAGWRDACPVELKPHVERIAKALGKER